MTGRPAPHARLVEVAALHSAGLSIAEAACLVGIPEPDPDELPERFDYPPSPVKIAAACAAFKTRWSPDEKRSRRNSRAGLWAVPVVATAGRLVV